MRRKPSLAEVFKRGHSTDDMDDQNGDGEASEDGIFIDAKSNRVWTKFLQLKASSSQSVETGTSENSDGGLEINAGDKEPTTNVELKNDLFFKAIGGYDKKGRLYGLGTLGKRRYQKGSSSHQGSSTKQSPSEHEIELENQVAMFIAENEA